MPPKISAAPKLTILKENWSRGEARRHTAYKPWALLVHEFKYDDCLATLPC